MNANGPTFDISEAQGVIHQLEEQLREAQAVKEELEASNRELEKFVQNLEEGIASEATAETEKSGEKSNPVDRVAESEKTDVHQVRDSKLRYILYLRLEWMFLDIEKLGLCQRS